MKSGWSRFDPCCTGSTGSRAAAGMEGKEVEVELEGEENGLDRLVQDRLYEPLLHIIRNAVGHGIETPEVRRRNGKPAVGRLTIQCSRDGEAFVVTVRDDGSGLDYQAIEGKAQAWAASSRPDCGSDATPVAHFPSRFLHAGGGRCRRGPWPGHGRRGEGIARLQGSVSLQSRPGLGTSVAGSLARANVSSASHDRADRRPEFWAPPASRHCRARGGRDERGTGRERNQTLGEGAGIPPGPILCAARRCAFVSAGPT